MSECIDNEEIGILDTYDTILSIIEISERVSCQNQNREEIIGRTVIQKLTYFTQHTCSNIELSEFKPHFYGPYSPKVSMRLEELVAYYFVDERKIIGRDYDGYKYRISKRGENMAGRIKTKFKDCYEEIETLVTKCNDVCKLKTTPLSYAAKIHYVLNKTKECEDVDDFKKRLKEFGWESSDKDIEQGINLFDKLESMKNGN